MIDDRPFYWTLKAGFGNGGENMGGQIDFREATCFK